MPLTNVDGNTLSYKVTGLWPGHQYEFRIIAVDATHNWSVPGPTIAVTTSLSTPTAKPKGGVVVSGTQVTLSTTTPLAEIYYTLDGSTPCDASIRYTGPITINAPVTIKAISKTFTYSEVITESYTIAEPISITGKYTVNPTIDTAYTCGKTISGIDTMTVNSGFNGLKYFTVNITPVIEHPGIEKVVFVQLSEGIQVNLNATGADFDIVHSAQAGFNVKPADVVKVYIMDDLTNDIDFNPTILE